MITVERKGPNTWTVGQLVKTGQWKPIKEFPTRIEAIRLSNKLNRQRKASKKHIQDEETQLLLFD